MAFEFAAICKPTNDDLPVHSHIDLHTPLGKQ